jgi:hypothetical protein
MQLHLMQKQQQQLVTMMVKQLIQKQQQQQMMVMQQQQQCQVRRLLRSILAGITIRVTLQSCGIS